MNMINIIVNYADITKYLEKYGVCIVDLLNEKKYKL